MTRSVSLLKIAMWLWGGLRWNEEGLGVLPRILPIPRKDAGTPEVLSEEIRKMNIVLPFMKRTERKKILQLPVRLLFSFHLI